jgi:hypothetical protein
VGRGPPQAQWTWIKRRRAPPLGKNIAAICRGKVTPMSGLDWGFTFTLGILYIALLFTVAVVTFRKGHWVMGLIGFVFPILWLIGAVIPPARRHR